MPVDIQMVLDYLIAKKQAQKKNFNMPHGVRPLLNLYPGQEVLFLSPANQHSYIPSTIIDKAPSPQSNLIDIKGKQYHRSREHICPLQQDLFKLLTPKTQETPKPTHHHKA